LPSEKAASLYKLSVAFERFDGKRRIRFRSMERWVYNGFRMGFGGMRG